MSPQPIHVLVADDHPIVRDGLSAILQTEPDIRLAGTASNFAEVLSNLGTIRVDVLVLDLGGMGGAPLALVKRIAREHPHVAIVAFSSSVDFAPELLQAGVRGYVAKEELSASLVTAIRTAQQGQRFLSQTVEEYVSRAGRREHEPLTFQELNVLRLIWQGLGTEAIAKQLVLTTNTTQNYITALRRKLGCEERTQLADWYRRMYGPEGH